MFRTIAEFTGAWQYENGNTLKMMQALTDASLAQRVSPEGRSLGRLAWHIVQTLGEMGGRRADRRRRQREDASAGRRGRHCRCLQARRGSPREGRGVGLDRRDFL
jgi:hypothetical protein